MSKRGPSFAPHSPYNVSDIDWARAAGFIEGEGCIRTQPGARVYCVISQRNVLPLLWFRDTFGGCLWQNSFGMWQWKITASLAVEDFLTHIEPYLWAKRDQAQIGLLILQRKLVGFPADDQMTKDLCRQLKEAKHVSPTGLPEFAELYDDLPLPYTSRTGNPSYRRRVSKVLVRQPYNVVRKAA